MSAERAFDAEFAPGFYPSLPSSVYHRTEAMSSSGAKKMIRSPLHYRLMREQYTEPTEAMQFGTACHSGILEPGTFERTVVCKPKFDMRKTVDKEASAAFLAQHANKVALAPEAFDRARRCIDAVMAHPAAHRLLQGARIEGSAFWYDGRHGVPCKARFDALNHGGIVDLKTTQDASPEGFARQAASLLYHVQAAAYNSGHEHALDSSMEFFAFICVESEAPHAVAVYSLPGNAVLAGDRLWNLALERYAKARKTGRFEGYPDTIQPLPFPRWATKFGMEP